MTNGTVIHSTKPINVNDIGQYNSIGHYDLKIGDYEQNPEIRLILNPFIQTTSTSKNYITDLIEVRALLKKVLDKDHGYTVEYVLGYIDGIVKSAPNT